LIENDTLIDAKEYPHPIVNITKIRLHNIRLAIQIPKEHLEEWFVQGWVSKPIS
jgi:starvation-inducible outer membrane lipoprotein